MGYVSYSHLSEASEPRSYWNGGRWVPALWSGLVNGNMTVDYYPVPDKALHEIHYFAGRVWAGMTILFTAIHFGGYPPTIVNANTDGHTIIIGNPQYIRLVSVNYANVNVSVRIESRNDGDAAFAA